MLCGSVLCKIHFNSHAHVERDAPGDYAAGVRGNFNSHAHVERDRSTAGRPDRPQDFNSHAHVERDLFTITMIMTWLISTHTLTWSVTLDVVFIWCLLNVMRTYFFI